MVGRLQRKLAIALRGGRPAQRFCHLNVGLIDELEPSRISVRHHSTNVGAWERRLCGGKALRAHSLVLRGAVTVFFTEFWNREATEGNRHWSPLAYALGDHKATRARELSVSGRLLLLKEPPLIGVSCARLSPFCGGT